MHIYCNVLPFAIDECHCLTRLRVDQCMTRPAHKFICFYVYTWTVDELDQ